MGLLAALGIGWCCLLCVTFLPALLSKLGDRVEKGRVPFVHRLRRKDGDSRVWGAILDRVLKRPLVSALLAGDVDVIVTSVTTLVGTRLAGADTIMIQTLVPTFVDHIVSVSSITELQHLKGKTGGVNRVGSTSDLGLRLALRRLGINPDSDTKIITGAVSASEPPPTYSSTRNGLPSSALASTILPSRKTSLVPTTS
jgi:hypothetical protein